jgi:Putative zinc-finger
MNERVAEGAEGACPSQWVLDRLVGGELSDVERARIERHAGGCARCAVQLAERAAAQAQFAPDTALMAELAAVGEATRGAASGEGVDTGAAERGAAPTRAARRWARPIWIVTPALAAAAAVVLLLRTPRPEEEIDPALDPARLGTRKGPTVGATSPSGSASRVRILVERGAARWELAGLGAVRPGDRIQATVELAEERFVAMYARDGAGVILRYAPNDAANHAPMIALPMGGERALPNSTILDEVLGRELLAVFVCRAAQTDEVLRAHVERGAPAGCEVSRLELVKEAR